MRNEREFYNRVYDILIADGGARRDMREAFVLYHLDESHDMHEWRFCGHFGFGGKYRKYKNRIDYYPEDETIELENLMDKINNKLEALRGKEKRT